MIVVVQRTHHLPRERLQSTMSLEYFLRHYAGMPRQSALLAGSGRGGGRRCSALSLAGDSWRGSSRINRSFARETSARADEGLPRSHWKNARCVLGPDSLYRIAKVVRGWFSSNPERRNLPITVYGSAMRYDATAVRCAPETFCR